MTSRAIAALSIALFVLSPMACQAKVVGAANGSSCTQARLDFCRAKFDDVGFGAAWLKNHCSKSPFGNRFEYLVPAWSCLRE